MSDELKKYLEELNKAVSDGFKRLDSEIQKTRIEIEIFENRNMEIRKNYEETMEFFKRLKKNDKHEAENQLSHNIKGIL